MTACYAGNQDAASVDSFAPDETAFGSAGPCGRAETGSRRMRVTALLHASALVNPLPGLNLPSLLVRVVICAADAKLPT